MSDANGTEGEALELTNQAAQPPISAEVIEFVRLADVSTEVREKALGWLGAMMTAAQTTGHPWTDPKVGAHFPVEDPAYIVFDWSNVSRTLKVYICEDEVEFMRLANFSAAWSANPNAATMALFWTWVHTGEWA
jgi:hypothetical protein